MPGLMPTKRTRTGVRTAPRGARSAPRGPRMQSPSGGRMTAMNWLFKEEPSHYSFDALVKDKRTVWSGVKNPLAQRHLHAVKRGDRIFYYHTGDEKAVVGVAQALGDAYADPGDNSGKQAVVDVGPVRKLP